MRQVRSCCACTHLPPLQSTAATISHMRSSSAKCEAASTTHHVHTVSPNALYHPNLPYPISSYPPPLHAPHPTGATVTLSQLKGISLRRPLQLPKLPASYLAEVAASAVLGHNEPGFENAPGLYYLANELYRAATNASLPDAPEAGAKYLLSFTVDVAGTGLNGGIERGGGLRYKTSTLLCIAMFSPHSLTLVSAPSHPAPLHPPTQPAIRSPTRSPHTPQAPASRWRQRPRTQRCPRRGSK